MQIDIQTHNFPLTDALRMYINRRLSFSLSARNHRIQRIMLWLSDVNGPKGGVDKCCQIKVVIPKMADIVIDDTKVNLYTAIDRAIHRASRTIERKLARHRDKARSSRIFDAHSMIEPHVLTGKDAE